MRNHSEPTYENQLYHARKLARERGVEALRNPHALTGESCGCGACFCCAALEVTREIERESYTPWKARMEARNGDNS